MEPDIWYLPNATGIPTVEHDRAKVEAYLRTDQRIVAKTQIGKTHVYTVFNPVGVDGPETRFWETMIEVDGEISPDDTVRLEKCGGTLAHAMAQHLAHVAMARQAMIEQPPPYTADHPLVAEWKAKVYNRADQIDGANEGAGEYWPSLALGWAIGCGLSIELAQKFAMQAPQ